MEKGEYACPISEKTTAPYIYVDDSIEATMMLLRAPQARLSRTTYQVAGISFSAEQWCNAVKKLLPKLKLTYFNMGGRAEPIRLALYIGGIPFEDERLSFPQFGEQKAAGRFPNGSVPILEVDGVVHAQNLALLTYAGKLAGLYPFDLVDAARVAEALFSFEDVIAVIAPTFKLQGEEQKAARLALADGALKTWIARFDAQLAKNGSGYLVGKTLTVADVWLYHFVNGLKGLKGSSWDGIPTDWVNQFVNVNAHHQLVDSHPKIQAYYASKQ